MRVGSDFLLMVAAVSHHSLSHAAGVGGALTWALQKNRKQPPVFSPLRAFLYLVDDFSPQKRAKWWKTAGVVSSISSAVVFVGPELSLRAGRREQLAGAFFGSLCQ